MPRHSGETPGALPTPPGALFADSFYATNTINASNINASSFNTFSKRELKRDINKFEERAIDILSSVEVVSYKMKKENDFKIGFIADDTHEYLSSKNHDKMDIINTLGLLIKSVQELTEDINNIKEKLEWL
jgi:hypothetical protein